MENNNVYRVINKLFDGTTKRNNRRFIVYELRCGLDIIKATYGLDDIEKLELKVGDLVVAAIKYEFVKDITQDGKQFYMYRATILNCGVINSLQSTQFHSKRQAFNYLGEKGTEMYAEQKLARKEQQDPTIGTMNYDDIVDYLADENSNESQV